MKYLVIELSTFNNSLEESPPKKRKIDSSQANRFIVVSEDEEKIEVDQSNSKAADEKTPTESKDDKTIDTAESKDQEKPAASSSTLPASSALGSIKIDLIKDIESHIEIIYECLDELNETINASGSNSSQNKAAPSEKLASSEAASQEPENAVKESTEVDSEKSDDHAAQNESKNE